MKNNSLIHSIIVVLISVLIISSCETKKSNTDTTVRNDSTEIAPEPKMEYGIVVDSFDVIKDVIKPNQNLSEILNPFGISYTTIDKIVNESDSIFDLRKMRSGKSYTFICERDSAHTVQYFIYEHSPVEYIVFDLTDSVKVYKGEKEVRVEMRTASGEIESSLWNAIAGRGFDPLLSNELSDIYAWSIDFFGLQVGDQFKMIYEERFVDTLSIGYGKIHSAWFYHMDTIFWAIPFFQDSVESYYDEKGNSLRKAFLKAPLKFSRISSGFSHSRMHPILKVRRPHLGVDYAAPTGTPVVAIGDGKVTQVGYRGAAGHMVKIRHNSNYETAYLHLSKYGPGITTGKFVKQGDVIGYVGSTGRSTGPHLDFRFYKNGQAIDPLKVEAPPVEPVKEENLERFNAIRDSIMNQLDLIEIMELPEEDTTQVAVDSMPQD